MDQQTEALDEEVEEMNEPRYGEGPEEEEHETREQEMQRAIRLDAFGASLSKSRSDAIAARQQSGIELIWQEDDDFYEGIDDLNRGDERFVRTSKPAIGGTGALQQKSRNVSRVFPNITAPFVESSSAHVADILLPTEDRPWSYDPTPIPELKEMADQYSKENPEEADAVTDKGFLTRLKEMVSGGTTNDIAARDDNMLDQNPGLPPDEAFKQVEMGKAKAEATELRVWDWQVECQFNAEARTVIEDAARIGVGILKGPVNRQKITVGWNAGEAVQSEVGDQTLEPVGEMKLKPETLPISKRIDPENFYPSKGCGQDIQRGDACWERDFISKRELRKLAKDDTYLSTQVEACLEEGPTRAIATLPETSSVENAAAMDDNYELWYGYVQADQHDLLSAGCDCSDIKDAHIDVMIVLVNNKVIKASLPTTDYAGFPYDIFCWRKRKGFWAGIGVSRQVRTAQKMVVGATRTMMNNAGLAGGPMIVMKQGVVTPADGVAGLSPRKVFYIKKDDDTIADATKAIGVVKVDIMVDEMLKIINLGLQLAENNSGFPLLMQGQMGQAPDLVGVVNVLDKNTNAIKRRLARSFSDDVMNPHQHRYYVYHLLYGPDNEKGDMQVNVKGYASLVERDIQNQELGQMAGLVGDPRFGLDPKKWAEEYLKSRHINPADMKIDDPEWEKLLENWQQMMETMAQGDPRIQVEKMRSDTTLKKAQMDNDFKGAIKLSDNEQAQLNRNLKMIEFKVMQEVGALKQAGVSADIIKKLKTDLAREMLKIRSTFQLANLQAPASALPTPAIEPPGKAPAGESYQK